LTPLPDYPLPDAEALYEALRHGVNLLLAGGPQPTHLVGITSGGAWLAERLQRDLGRSGEPGIVSSALHRDDFARRGLASARQTSLPFDVNGAHLLLIDDVLFTGRTLRAVLNELFDHGRPASVRLAVLVDRGGRELPIQADLAAARLPVPADRTLSLARTESGQLTFNLEARQP